VNVQCRADPCPLKRMICDVCPHLEDPNFRRSPQAQRQS
jgi:hypothetical protein